MNNDTVLYQLTETSKFMMSFVIITKKNNAIVTELIRSHFKGAS